jgi:hypothetical protein
MALTTEERKELHAKIDTCKGIAFDTCHKIYILMDEEEVNKMKGYGYEALIKAEHSTPSIMYSTVLNWYKNSCGFEFINATSTSLDGAGTDFYTIAGQR